VGNKYETIDDYIASKPIEVQPILETVRETLRKALPPTDEAISYQIPTFKLDGKYVVYFTAWKNHRALKHAIFDAVAASTHRNGHPGFPKAVGHLLSAASWAAKLHGEIGGGERLGQALTTPRPTRFSEDVSRRAVSG
jgi:uncharacterized protein YdhG (YjbR/CyaY superfamily)